MRAIGRAIKPSAHDPRMDDPRILPGRQVRLRSDPAGKEVVGAPASNVDKPRLDRGSGLLGDLELHRTARLLLNDGRAITNPSADADIIDLQLHERAERAGSRVIILTVDGPAPPNWETLVRLRRTDTRQCDSCHGRTFRDFPRLVKPKNRGPDPMRLGDPLGDHRQRAIALALVLEAVFVDKDSVGVPAPLTYQGGAGLQQTTGIVGQSFFLRRSGQGPQVAPQRAAAGATMGTLLQIIG